MTNQRGDPCFIIYRTVRAKSVRAEGSEDRLPGREDSRAGLPAAALRFGDPRRRHRGRGLGNGHQRTLPFLTTICEATVISKIQSYAAKTSVTSGPRGDAGGAALTRSPSRLSRSRTPRCPGLERSRGESRPCPPGQSSSHTPGPRAQSVGPPGTQSLSLLSLLGL